MLKDPKFRNDLSSTLTQINTLVSGINEGRGTLGKLTTDDAAYTNLNALLTESTNLVTTIRKDPKKYLTIHLKIF
jgi:phospholipid/cholesterol/gamma-HCH transport system substrate-binding protein